MGGRGRVVIVAGRMCGMSSVIHAGSLGLCRILISVNSVQQSFKCENSPYIKSDRSRRKT